MKTATLHQLNPTDGNSIHHAGAITQRIEAFEQSDWFRHAKNGTNFSACLGLLLEGLGWRGDVRQLADVMPRHTGAFDLFHLFNSMAFLGYEYKTQKRTLGSVQAHQLPCLFLPAGTGYARPIVITQKTEDGLTCYDDSDKTTSTIAPDKAYEQGDLITFAPRVDHTDAAEEHAKRKTGITWFQLLLGRFGNNFWQLFFIGILINAVALAAPLFVMGVYNKVIGAYSLHSLKYLLLGISVAIVVECVLRYMRVHALSWFGARINHIVSTSIFEQLLYMPALYVEHASVSSQLARLKAFESVRDFFTGPMFLVVLELPFVVVLLAAIWMIAGPVVVVSAGAIICLGLLSLFILRRMKLETFRLARASSERQQLAVEGITKIHALRYSGMGPKWLERYTESSAKCAVAGRDSAYTASLLEHLSHAIALLAIVITIVMSVERIWAEQMTSGALVAVMILSWRVMNPLQNICSMLPSLQQVYNSIQQVNRLMQVQTERPAYKTALVYKPFKGQVTFHQVGLRYGRRGDPVFTGLSFEAKPGQCIAITGANGSGKSSILSLVAGLYAPQVGTIRIDGTDIRQMDPVVLRRHLTLIPQTPEFFSGTVMENLQLSHPTLTEDEAMEALRELDAHKDIERLPAGLHTMIGSGGVTLPGRLLYRLNLARAMVSPCSIILCDELPYAILNSSTGERFKSFLKAQRGVRTVLMVAHREDYMQIADKLLVLQPEKKPLVARPDEILPHLRKARS